MNQKEKQKELKELQIILNEDSTKILLLKGNFSYIRKGRF